MTRVLITGSREFGNNPDSWNLMRDALLKVAGKDIVLVHGNAAGADKMAAHIWSNWNLPTEAHTAQWDRLGKRAGYVRNEQMVASGADVCIAFLVTEVPEGVTANRGTDNCIALAEQRGIPVVRVTLAYAPPVPYNKPPVLTAETLAVEPVETKPSVLDF